jgi:hypothetical protein
MKKIYLMLIIVGMINVSFAQKTTGVVNLGSLMTVKFDLNNATTKVTMTLTGPSDKYLAVGLDAVDMSSSSDYVIVNSATTVGDYTGVADYAAPIADANNWTIVTNNVVGSTRTIVATRAFNSGDAADYVFNYASSGLNLIWAYGPDFNVNNEHLDKGATTATFSLLGIKNFSALDSINIYPNPSNGVFTLTKNSAVEISKIRVYDTNAKLLKEIDAKQANQNGTINVSELSAGIYFMEISNDTDKTVKKLLIN